MITWPNYGDVGVRVTHIPTGVEVESWGSNFPSSRKLKDKGIYLLKHKIHALTIPRNTDIVSTYDLPDGVDQVDEILFEVMRSNKNGIKNL